MFALHTNGCRAVTNDPLVYAAAVYMETMRNRSVYAFVSYSAYTNNNYNDNDNDARTHTHTHSAPFRGVEQGAKWTDWRSGVDKKQREKMV